MAMKLSTTLRHINTIPNDVNAEAAKECVMNQLDSPIPSFFGMYSFISLIKSNTILLSLS